MRPSHDRSASLRATSEWKTLTFASRSAFSVGAAEHDDDVLIARRFVSSGKERGERGCSAGLDEQTKDVPQHVLRAHDVLVLDEQDAVDVLLRDRKHQFANAPRCERIGGDAAGASTGLPAFSASVSVGAPTGSTPMTRGVWSAYQAATPPIKPPPPTATRTVAAFGT